MMTNDDYQHFVCIVAGDNPDELMKPYDRREEEEPYVRYHYKDAAKIKEKYVELYEGILNSDEERNFVQSYLKEKGIPSMVYYPKPLHKQTVYESYDFNLSDLDTCENLSNGVLSLPMHPYLNEPLP